MILDQTIKCSKSPVVEMAGRVIEMIVKRNPSQVTLTVSDTLRVVYCTNSVVLLFTSDLYLFPKPNFPKLPFVLEQQPSTPSR